ncbi:hypothetical protein WJX73_006025 [Symbiochloris irregularis]|uniref:Amino acid transporter transmembrane domain-containing protein n=1 Tax=Symbiochloris irregularis TaxID=706552 RepID=A0AAW1NPR7_9CHLO
MVGAGVLGLAYATKYLGWTAGTVVLLLSWLISLYTLHQLADLAEVLDREGNPVFDEEGRPIRVNRASLILIHVPSFNSLRWVSLVAAAMSLSYSSIGIGGSLAAGKQPGVEYNLDGYSTSAGIFNVFNALGIVAFAYGVMEIQASMRNPEPKTPGGPPGRTYYPMMKGVYVAYAIVAWCYFGNSFAGYHSFGNAVEDNVLASIPGPDWIIAMADMFVVIHVIGSYQVFTMPVMDMIEVKFHKLEWKMTAFRRFMYRTTYVVVIAVVACVIPFFGSLMGFIGALGTGPTTFWLPPLIWLKVKKPPITSWHFWASWVCIILGILVTILGAIGGLRDIIVNATSYKPIVG